MSRHDLCLCLVLLISFWLCYGDGTCNWNVHLNNKTLAFNLETLQKLNEPIECALASDWRLMYTPCRNGLNCSIQNGSMSNISMVAQVINGTNPSCAAYLGIWDSGKTQPLYKLKNNIEQFTFEYTNGLEPNHTNCTNGRWINVTYICDKSVEFISDGNITCRELRYCYYEIVIPTKLACLVSHRDDPHGTSTAWRATIWLSILCGAIFIFYCIAGYVMNAARYHQWLDCMANIPNANIWCCCCYKQRDYITIQDAGGGLINAPDQSATARFEESDTFH
eukprot:1047031_1